LASSHSCLRSPVCPEGSPYDGPDPDAFYSRDQFVGMLEDYATRHRLPVEIKTPVLELAPRTDYGAFGKLTPKAPLYFY